MPRTSRFAALGAVAVTLVAGYALAQDAKKTAAPTTSPQASTSSGAHDGMRPGHVMIQPSALTWKDGPPSLPGTKLAVLEGDLSKPGPFTVRLKLPAGLKIPPHYHPAIEHVTVLEGSFSMGLGETWDDKALVEHGPGGFMVMDVGTRHFAASKGGGVIQLHGIGPWGITFVNPADDPTKKAARK